MNERQIVKSELTPLLDEEGRQKYADGGAVQQDGRKPIKVCSNCQGKVVFVESTKTGKWYLVDVFPYADMSDKPVVRKSYFYAKSKPHFKSCERKASDRVRQEEQDKKDLAEARYRNSPENLELLEALRKIHNEKMERSKAQKEQEVEQ